MVKRAIPAIMAAEWPPERSLRAVDSQLREIDTLKKLNFQTGDNAEESWKQVTDNIFRRAFDSDSLNFRNLMWAKNAGEYRLGMQPGEYQQNYVKRLEAYETCLKSAIQDLKMSLPEEEIKGIYDGGDEYAFCRDLRGLIQLATRDVLIVDPYLDPALFDLYVDSLAPSVIIRVLTSNLKINVQLLAQKFSSGRINFELRTDPTLHDRVVFADDRHWVIGQSIKDAAKKKPTYIIEHSHYLMLPLYDGIWNKATSQIKS
jgi:hypothetical protein